MKKKEKIKICFMGGNQAGILGALTALSVGIEIKAAVAYGDEISSILKKLGVKVYKSISSDGFKRALKSSDVLVSVHGREIMGLDLLSMPRFGGINVHPYLYKYKGRDPVGRALKVFDYKASVGAHFMTEEIDVGKVLVEKFLDITGVKTSEEAYNRLYPLYISVILSVLEKITRRKNGRKKVVQ